MQVEDERQKHSKMESVFTDGEKMENGTDLHFIEYQSTSLTLTLALALNQTQTSSVHFLSSHTDSDWIHTGTVSTFLGFSVKTQCFFCVCVCVYAGDANRQISEFKFKLSKAEQEMGTMEQNVSNETLFLSHPKLACVQLVPCYRDAVLILKLMCNASLSPLTDQ